MTLYNAEDFTPPAPVVLVVLRDVRSGSEAHDVPMLMDSGADITLIPRHVVSAMNLPTDQSKGYEIVGFNGSVSIEHPVQLELLVLGRSFKGSFLCTDNSYGILGRNILNHVRLILDGPSLAWDVHPSR